MLDALGGRLLGIRTTPPPPVINSIVVVFAFGLSTLALALRALCPRVLVIDRLNGVHEDEPTDTEGPDPSRKDALSRTRQAVPLTG